MSGVFPRSWHGLVCCMHQYMLRSCQRMGMNFEHNSKYKNSTFILKFRLELVLPYSIIAWKVSKYGVFSGPYFPTFGLNTEVYSVNLRIQSKCRKIRTRKNSLFGHFSRSTSDGDNTIFTYYPTKILSQWYVCKGFWKIARHRNLKVCSRSTQFETIGTWRDFWSFKSHMS